MYIKVKNFYVFIFNILIRFHCLFDIRRIEQKQEVQRMIYFRYNNVCILIQPMLYNSWRLDLASSALWLSNRVLFLKSTIHKYFTCRLNNKSLIIHGIISILVRSRCVGIKRRNINNKQFIFLDFVFEYICYVCVYEKFINKSVLHE